MLRVNPGIEAHTHLYLQTGTANSKFGLPIGNGDAEEAVALALAHPRQLRLLGYHAHVGTQILDAAPYGLLTRTLLVFAERMRVRHGFWPSRISPGGGGGITYTDEAELDPAQWIEAVLREADAVRELAVPHIDIEPGRAIVGPAGMAVYTIGHVKRTDGGRTYVVVDGGMADNIRPALYQARYIALAATRMREAHSEQVTVAGPYCESGDILIEEALLPTMLPGENLVVPATGAYCLSMSSNYNGALRPAVVVVEDGEARLVQRRQTVADLVAIEHP
jgi:diaminopimelate decarboxylase